MKKELIINATSKDAEIALLENSKLVELHYQKNNTNFSVGDVFLGRIKKLMPGLNAAFVDIGHERDAFLHYTDLGPKLTSLLNFTEQVIQKKYTGVGLENFKFAPEIDKNGSIDQVLNKRQPVLLQILKEPISTKGLRLSCEITIPGRFLILTPFSNVVAISKKITSTEERNRLKNLIESIKPPNFGIIVRTAADGKKVMDLHEELNFMMEKWKSMVHKLEGASPPEKVLSEMDKTAGLLRDLLSDSFSKVIVNDEELYLSIQNYLKNISPQSLKILELHKSNKHIFEAYGINKQIKSSFGKTATMNSGAYLVIEHTEAMHVIDVNSGHKVSSKDQAEAVLAVNLESAEEIARQLRLRDIGGLIIIDFIDMRVPEHKKELLAAMRKFMNSDRAQHTILPLSKFGLMQITRQRVRPEVKINTTEVCPTCRGTGKANASILVMDDIERDLSKVIHSRPSSKLYLHVHEFIGSYLKKGVPSIQMKWFKKYFKWIRIVEDPQLAMLDYKFYDENKDEIRL